MFLRNFVLASPALGFLPFRASAYDHEVDREGEPAPASESAPSSR